MLPEKDTIVYTRHSDKVTVARDKYVYTPDNIPRRIDELIADLQKIREEGEYFVHLTVMPEEFSDDTIPCFYLALPREPTPEEIIETKRKEEEEAQRIREWQLRNLEDLKAQMGVEAIKKELGL
jgi:hypothetical protein